MDTTLLDRIREGINIVDLIGSYLPLKKSGTNYKARCPFHEEKTGSFMVSETKQIYRCFGCGKSGNVFTFLRDYERITFFDAVKKLAERLGISIQETQVNTIKKTRMDLLFTINRLATDYYKQNLRLPTSELTRFIEQRKLTLEIMEKFELGYAPDSYGGLKNYLQKNEINTQIFESCGLFIRTDMGMTDRFRNRLVFPIHAASGKVVAFSARVLLNEQPGGKYVNSPTTDLYTKGKELYGLFETRHDIAKKNFVLICEGNIDFLRLYAYGFKNSVASLGTALTVEQVFLLSRYTQNFYIINDGDSAGQKATLRSAGLIIQKGYSVKIVDLPMGEDPDTFLLKKGAEALQVLIDQAVTLPEFTKNSQNLEMTEKEKITFLKEIGDSTTDELSRELFIKEVAKVFGIHQTALEKRTDRPKPVESKPVDESKEYLEEKEYLKLLLNDKEINKRLAEELNSDYFFNERYRNLYLLLTEKQLFEFVDNPALLLEKIEDEKLNLLMASLLMDESLVMTEAEIINQMKLKKLRRDLNIVTKQMNQNVEDMELFEKKQFLSREIRRLSNKVVNKTLF